MKLLRLIIKLKPAALIPLDHTAWNCSAHKATPATGKPLTTDPLRQLVKAFALFLLTALFTGEGRFNISSALTKTAWICFSPESCRFKSEENNSFWFELRATPCLQSLSQWIGNQRRDINSLCHPTYSEGCSPCSPLPSVYDWQACSQTHPMFLCPLSAPPAMAGSA